MPQCLETIATQTYPALQVILVDNASSDGSQQWIAALPSSYEKIFLDKNTGITGGNNAGMQRCLEKGCRYIFLLNNDTVLEPDAIEKLVAATEPNRLLIPRIYFYDAPTVINTNFGDFDYVRGITLPRFYGEKDSEKTSQSSLGTMASTCALMFPSSLVEEIGMMDEKYFMYFDDTDFVARAVNHGYKVKYVPESKLLHMESSSSGGDALGPLPLYYQTRNRLYFMRKHQGSVLKRTLFASYFWMTRAVKLANWLLRGDRKSLFAFASAIRDYRGGKLGHAAPSRYRLEPG
jgi:GT2 family glycosyltransferase